MKKRTFKKIIGLLLSMVLLIVPCSNTAIALDEQISTANIEAYAVSNAFEGAYFLKNPLTGRYIEIDNNASSYDGAKLEQRDYDGDFVQKWAFTQVTRGSEPIYHTIMNVEAGLYMTVENDSTGAASIILEPLNGTGSDGQLWSMEETADGRYKITPKSGASTGYVLGVNDGLFGATGNGLDIKTRVYTDDTNYRDEWYLEFCSEYVCFNYDQAYIDRNNSGGSEYKTTVMQRIAYTIKNNYFPIVANAFAQECGIYLINNQGIIPAYTSDGDNCVNSGYRQLCRCIENEECLLKYNHSPKENNYMSGFAYNSHCKSLIRLRNNLIYDIPEDTIRITYTGHANSCYYNGVKHTTSSENGNESITIALSDYDYPIISINVTQHDEQQALYTLIHELSHTYGAIHHYGEGDYPCVMNSNDYENFDVNDPSTYWCDSCEAIIRNNANKEFLR